MDYLPKDIYDLFDRIDKAIHAQMWVTTKIYSDSEKADLLYMLSEHYGQLADKYAPKPDAHDNTDPYAEQPYCPHCGTDLRPAPEKPLTNLLPDPNEDFIGLLEGRIFIRLGGTSHFLEKHSFLQIAANICDKFFGTPL